MTEEFKYTVEAKDLGMRIDKYVAVQLGEDYSRMYVKKLMENDMLTVNGEKVKAKYPVVTGDEIRVTLLPMEGAYLEAEDIPLKILFEMMRSLFSIRK